MLRTFWPDLMERFFGQETISEDFLVKFSSKSCLLVCNTVYFHISISRFFLFKRSSWFCNLVSIDICTSIRSYALCLLLFPNRHAKQIQRLYHAFPSQPPLPPSLISFNHEDLYEICHLFPLDTFSIFQTYVSKEIILVFYTIFNTHTERNFFVDYFSSVYWKSSLLIFC